MSNELVPEESAQEYQQLLSTFRSSSQKRTSITDEEQRQIISHVRERLAQATPAATLPDVGAFTSTRPFVALVPAKRTRTATRFIASLVAALVVVGLIFGSWTLFQRHPSPNGTPVSPVASGSGPLVHTQAGGLEASMHVLIGGPYFLSELLPVDVSLSNHTHKTITLDGVNRTADLCFSSALMVQVTGGGNPFFTFPRLESFCTLPAFVTPVEPGQTIMIHQYIPLTRSGEVTLTMGLSSHNLPDLLKGHWPGVHLQVKPQVPQDRALSLLQRQRQVTVSIPVGMKPHLLFMQSISCENYHDGDDPHWMPLSTTVLQKPTCPTSHPHWKYIVSAPGYSIVSGSQ